MSSAAKSNVKDVTLELGGKSANVIFADADLDQAAAWSTFGAQLISPTKYCSRANSNVLQVSSSTEVVSCPVPLTLQSG